MFISGITFVGYDVGFFPIGYMKILVFVEVFSAQVIILGFIFVIFGQLIQKLQKEDSWGKF